MAGEPERAGGSADAALPAAAAPLPCAALALGGVLFFSYVPIAGAVHDRGEPAINIKNETAVPLMLVVKDVREPNATITGRSGAAQSSSE